MNETRSQIDEIDKQIVVLLGKRMKLVKEIGKLTKETATGLLKIGKRLLGVERKQKGLKEIPREEVATQQQITPSAGKPNEKETHWAIPDQEK